MKERPIILNGEMVRSVLTGNKTQTRRPVPQWQQPKKTEGADVEGLEWMSVAQNHRRWGFGVFGKTETECMDNYNTEFGSACPFGKKRDRLWVRETCKAEELESGLDGVRFAADDAFVPIQNTQQAAEDWLKLSTYRKRKYEHGKSNTVPSIHMPRWASRILLEITDIRVERVQDISESDAIAEGVEPNCAMLDHSDCDHDNEWVHYGRGFDDFPAFSAKESYESLWQKIYGNWNENPWVWVIDFKPVEIKQ